MRAASPSELHVWRIDLDAAPAPAPDDLPPAERAEALGLRHPDHRRRVLAARWAVRRILSRYAGRAPGALAFTTGPHGKPALADPGDLHFNPTHTGALALVAVARAREVGIDAELVRPRRNLPALAGRLGAGAAEAVASAPEAERAVVFHRLWVRHEATVKCHGTGLAAPAPASPVHVVDLDVGPGAVAAVAAAGNEPIGVTLLELDD